MITKKNNTIYNVKPKDFDINYEYICPECGFNHWITQIESRTKHFKIACDCGAIIIPARITEVKLKYTKYKPKKTTINNSQKTEQQNSEQAHTTVVLTKEILEQASSSLQNYGFEKNEADDLIKQAFGILGVNEVLPLLKQALQSLGANNNASFTQAD